MAPKYCPECSELTQNVDECATCERLDRAAAEIDDQEKERREEKGNDDG